MEDGDPVTLLQQGANQSAPNEQGAANDQDVAFALGRLSRNIPDRGA
jgi:hypothetical protein